MLPVEVLRLDLRLRRRMLVGTALGAAIYLFVVIAAYPSFRTDSTFDELIAANPAAAAAFGITGSITSPAGWLSANMYANVAPLLALLLSIGYGASAIAGQDGDGLLGLIATQPISRGRLLLAKLSALFGVAALVPVITYAVCLAGPRFQLTPDWGRLGQVTAALTLLAFNIGALALLAGALFGSRGAALGVASAVAGAAYLVSALAPVNAQLRDLRWISPFTWAVGDGQLAGGVSWPQAVALVGLGAVLSAAAAVGFARRDLR